MPEHSALRQFLVEIEEQKKGIHHQPFTAIKKRIRWYQSVFIGIGILFVILGFFVYHKTSLPTLTILFQELESIKGVVCSFCGALATGAWAFGLSLRSHKESVKYPLQSAREQLARTYRKMRADKGWHHIYLFGHEAKEQVAFREIYRDTREQLYDLATKTSQILLEIKRSPTLSHDKIESLSNEAMLDLTKQLTEVVHSFRT